MPIKFPITKQVLRDISFWNNGLSPLGDRINITSSPHVLRGSVRALRCILLSQFPSVLTLCPFLLIHFSPLGSAAHSFFFFFLQWEGFTNCTAHASPGPSGCRHTLQPSAPSRASCSCAHLGLNAALKL